MIGAIMFGLDQGNFGNVQTFTDFRQYWCIDHGAGGGVTNIDDCDENNHHWNDVFVMIGASGITFGAAAGALLVGPIISDSMGRRPCISIGGIICFVGCLFASYLSFGSIPVFMIGRFITGFGVGVCCFALPLYNSEIA